MGDISLIIFRNKNCPKCKTLKPIFEKFLKNHPEIMGKVFEYEKDYEFFYFFNIKTVPAFIVRQDRRNALKYEGLIDYDTLEYIFKEKIKCI